MIQRILTLCRYLFFNQLFSLSGAIFTIATFIYYFLAFQQPTPEIDYFILVICLFGGALSLLVTLSVATRAHMAASYPFFTRLPNRVEYLIAILITSLIYATTLEIILATLALWRHGPQLTINWALIIPPLWLAVNLVMSTLALHATDLVTKEWSRTYIFTTLAVFLLSQTPSPAANQWLVDIIRQTARWFQSQDQTALFTYLQNFSTKVEDHIIGNTLGTLFWPFKAIADGTINGSFTRPQALAPALLILYATFLFLLAADFLATKDLHLIEE
ncbi:MAG TPA: hypothetical protein VLL52_14285 [Anaerolineae bacterium]|nr:hypothetical protein [Anaerolineae bacterium]